MTFTATVLPTAVTGSVTFMEGNTALGTGTITNGVASFTTSTLPAGAHTIVANYGGDSNYSSSVSGPLTQTVNKVTPVLPIPTVSAPNTTVGSPETISETVPAGVTGPVSFYDGSTLIGTGTIVNGVATITVTTLPLGNDSITATTPADANNNAATSPAVIVDVTKGSPTITLTSSANPSTTNEPVTFTATVPAGVTGTITFLENGNAVGTGTIANGQATLTTSTLPFGTQTITATYPGDASYNSASSAPLTQTGSIKKAPTLPPPGVSAPAITVGGSETITEVVPAGVTGPVTFFNGTTEIGTAPIVNGVATIIVSTLPLGTDSITASTPADANNNAATSPATSVTVNKLTPTLPPPTVSTTTPAVDSPVTITEQIPPGVTGPVAIYDGGTLLGTVPVINGVATITVPSLPFGPNPITVVTPGDANTNPATSPTTEVTVVKGITSVLLVSSVNPSEANQAVTFTASVHPGATGAVTFLDGGTAIGTGPVSAAGVAVITTSGLAIGSHSITAAYGGDANYAAATSAVLNQTVKKIPTAIVLTESSAAQLLNGLVTFTATVSASTPTPTGMVTFLDGTTVIGTSSVTTNGGVVVNLPTTGNALLVTSAMATGAHKITAVYSGDSTFAPSTSAPADNMVEDFTNVNSGPASQNLFPGDKTSYKFTLSPLSATTFLNDVNVTVTGLPEGSTYTVTPAAIAAGSGTTGIVLNVQTSSSLKAGNRMPQNPASHRELPIALGMLGLAGLGSIRKLRRKIPRTLFLLLLAIGSLLPIGTLSGCAGGYFTLTPTTYTVTVTGVEGSIQHSATATLSVQ